MTKSSIRPPPADTPTDTRASDDALDKDLHALHQHIAQEPVPGDLKARAIALQKAVDLAGKPLAAADKA